MIYWETSNKDMCLNACDNWVVNSNKEVLIQFLNAGQWGRLKWHNKPYTVNIHRKPPNTEYNEGVDHMKSKNI